MSWIQDASPDLRQLLPSLCDEEASQADLDALESLVGRGDNDIDLVVEYLQLHSDLVFEFRTRQASEEVLREIGAAPPTVVETWPPAPLANLATTPIHGAFHSTFSGWPLAYLIATVIFGIGLAIGTFVNVSQPEQITGWSPASAPQLLEAEAECVGRITGTFDCGWNGSSRVSLGQRLELASGLMEITYRTGAKVILQGPVTYQAESGNGGFLAFGKLTGKVEVEKAKGFMVRTPTATVTDLGTEFGVEVGKEGHTTSRVFRGSVEVQAVSRTGTADGGAQVLHEGETAVVENGGHPSDGNHITMLAPSAKPVGFVRAIPKNTIKTLDLVDVVAGGDGFSGRRNRGIDPSSGRLLDRLPKTTKRFHLAGDGAYHRVDESPLIDGVFIPNGSAGPVQIDSAGHTFDRFPPTDNRTYGYIWAGSVKPSCYAPGCNVLGAINYGSSGHGLLDMLSNKGITFDLEAIRKASPGRRLLRLRAVVGNTAPAAVQDTYEMSDVWVLVDGRGKFNRQKLRAWQGAIPIVVPIADKDRFLTLATTDGGDGHAWDWLVFGDPVLDVQETSEIGGIVRAAQPLAPATRGRSDPPEPRSVQTSFDANADMIENQTGGAPSPTYDHWSVGYRLLAGDGEGLSGTNLHPFAGDQHLACDEFPVRGWQCSPVSMGVMANTRGEDYRNVNGVVFGKNIICMHPGDDGSRVVLRWTAPRNGVVKTSTVFSAIHGPVTDVHLLLVHDGVVKSLFAGEINCQAAPKIDRLDASQSAVAVSAGDSIEVVVGWGSDHNNGGDSTGVFHSIMYISEPDARQSGEMGLQRAME